MLHLKKGDVLSSRYEIDELLGEGSMGRVYRALDRESRRGVAVKVLKQEGSGDPRLVRRFEREIETLRRLAHPDILQYVDHGRDGGVYYLVVELLSGRMLGQLAAEFVGQAERVLKLGIRLARAFDSAHRAGVIHRDIKPGNIQITLDGAPRILDYGLARWVPPEGMAAGVAPTMDNLTRSNVLMGTIPYMSPEQLRAEPVDRRSDIFSLAMVLYELACGQRPYRGDSIASLLIEMENGTPRALAEVQPALGEAVGIALDAVLRRALRPQSHLRFQTMGELAQALEGAADLGSSIPRDASIAVLLPPQSVRADRTAITPRGRDDELSGMLDALAAARAGNGSTLIVRGSRGIGKSLLTDELVRRAHRAGFLVLTATPAASEVGDHPARAWLQRAAEVFPGDAGVKDALSRFESSPSAPAVPAGPDVRAETREQRAFAAVAGLCARMPLVLVLEDVHAASAAVVRMLADVAAVAAGLRMVLVVTQRSDAVLFAEINGLLAELSAAPGARAIDLGPLKPAELGAMVEEAYPGVSLAEATLAELHERSGGNPWFARGILRLLEQRGVLERDGQDWSLAEPVELPSSPEAESVLEQRLAGLAAEDVELLAAAAVLGLQFPPALLAALLDRDEHEVTARLRWLDTERHLVLGHEDSYHFDERLSRAILLRRLAPARRTELHARAGRLLLAKVDEADPRHVVAVAAHLEQADAPGEALPWMVKAGLLLRQNSSPAEAIPWLMRARAIIEVQLAREGVPSSIDLAELDLALGECLHLVARDEEALEHLEKARGMAIDTGKPRLHARSLILLSHAYFARGELLQAQRKARDGVQVARRAALDVERALALSAEAKATSREGDFERAEQLWTEASDLLVALGKLEEAAEVQFRLANHHFRLERLDRAEACYSAAAAGADRQRNPPLYARIQNARGAVLLSRRRAQVALPYFEEASAVWRSIGARREEAMGRHNLAYCHQLLGRLDQAQQEYAEVMALRRAIGDAAGYSSSQRNYAEVLLELGRIEEAQTEAAAALASKRQLEDRVYLPQCIDLVGDVELMLGRLQRAREAFGEILRDFSDIGDAAVRLVRARTGLARAEWLAGNLDAAARLFDEVGAGLSRWNPSSAAIAVPTYWLLRFLCVRGAPPARLHELADPWIAASVGPALPDGKIYEQLAASVLDRADGAHEAARGHLAAALETAHSVGLVEWTFRIHRDLAALAPEGSPERSVELARAATIVRRQAATFRNAELRASYLAQRERAELLRSFEAVSAPSAESTETEIS